MFLLVVLLLAIGAAGLSERAALLDSPSSVPSWAPYVLIGAGLGGALLAVLARRVARRFAALEIGGLLAAAALAWVGYLLFQPDDKKGPRSAPAPTATATPTPTPTGRSGGPAGTHAVSWPWLELGLVVAGIAVVAVILLALAYRHGPPGAPADEDLAERARTAVAAGRAALRGGDNDREAVIACYAAMEAALVGHGVRRQVTDTPSDVLERAASAGLLGPEAATAANELAGLFHHARFSTGPLPPDAVTAAEGSLARIGHELDVRITAGSERP